MGTRGTEPVDISSLPTVPHPIIPCLPPPMLQSPLIVAVTANSWGATRPSALCAVDDNGLFGNALNGCTYPPPLRLSPASAAAAAGPESSKPLADVSSTFFSSRCPPPAPGGCWRSSSDSILANGPVRGLQCKLRTPMVTCGPPHPTLLAGLRYECGRHV